MFITKILSGIPKKGNRDDTTDWKDQGRIVTMNKHIDQIAEELKFRLSKETLVNLARESEFMERIRDIEPDQLLWSLLQSFSTHQAHEIAGLHRSFVQDSRQEVSYSAFWGQVSKESFPRFVTALYQQQISQLYLEHQDKLPEVFKRFADVRLHDGSSWAINDLLSELYPGRFTKVSPAAIELHATYSLKTMSYQKLVMAPDTQSEHDFIPEGEADVLYLLDRGYVNLPKLERMTEVGGYYIVRSRTNCNPLITAVNRGSSYQNRSRVGKKFNHRLLKKGKDYDFQVQIKAGDGQVYALRFVVLWNPQTKKHTGFLTNLPLERVSSQEIGQLYRLRWQIELSFKELKSYSSLKRFQTANEYAIEAFVMLSILAMQLRRYLVFCAEQLNPVHRLSPHKAAISAHNFMPAFIKCMMEETCNLTPVLLQIGRFLQVTMRFSNSHRKNAFSNWRTAN